MKTSLSMFLLAIVTVVMLSGCASNPYPLHKAVLVDDRNTARSLIEKGADVNARDELGQTPLAWAFSGERKEVAILLINKGADLNARNVNGFTPLHEAATRKDFVGVAEALINKGADVNARHNWGGTPLHVAIQFNTADVAILLINKGANVNAKDKNGATPLMFANTTEVANFLISKGADVKARRSDGKTALEAQHEYMKAVKKLEIAQQQKATQQKQEEQVQQRLQAEQRQAAPQPQVAQQPPQTEDEQTDSGNSLTGFLGAAVMNHVGSKIRSDNTTGSAIVGDTVSNMGSTLQTSKGRDTTLGAVVGDSARNAALGRGSAAINSAAPNSAIPGEAPTASGNAPPSGRMSASERIAGNRAWGAPDNFETYNGRICRVEGARNYCKAERTEYERGLGGLEKFGKSRGGTSQAKVCNEAYVGRIGDPQVDSNCQYAQELQCMFSKTKDPQYQSQKRKVCAIENSVIQQTVTNGWICRYCP